MGRVIVFFALIFPAFVVSHGQSVRYKFKRSQTAYVPETVEETSGLFFYAGELVTHNDSGGDSRLYLLDTLGGELRGSIPVPGAVNRDWEAVSVQGNTLYIGDFGNNNGRRQDLCIYITDLSGFPKAVNGLDSIRFSYAGQTTFENRKRNHDYDCEAMVVFKDTVYLYSKAWADGITHLRTLPATPGTYVAEERSTFEAGGLITDAAFDGQRNRLALLGYDLENQILRPFLWLFDTDHPVRLRNGVRISLSPEFTQTEGITFLPSGKIAITAEGLNNRLLDIAPALFLVWPEELPGKIKNAE